MENDNENNENREDTTVRMFKTTLDQLESLKEHPRISNNEMIGRLIEFYIRYRGVVEKE